MARVSPDSMTFLGFEMKAIISSLLSDLLKPAKLGPIPLESKLWQDEQLFSKTFFPCIIEATVGMILLDFTDLDPVLHAEKNIDPIKKKDQVVLEIILKGILFFLII